MNDPEATPILAVQGATNGAIQALLMAFARRLSGSGVRIVGAVEEPGLVSEGAGPLGKRSRFRHFGCI